MDTFTELGFARHLQEALLSIISECRENHWMNDDCEAVAKYFTDLIGMEVDCLQRTEDLYAELQCPLSVETSTPISECSHDSPSCRCTLSPVSLANQDPLSVLPSALEWGEVPTVVIAPTKQESVLEGLARKAREKLGKVKA